MTFSEKIVGKLNKKWERRTFLRTVTASTISMPNWCFMGGYGDSGHYQKNCSYMQETSGERVHMCQK